LRRRRLPERVQGSFRPGSEPLGLVGEDLVLGLRGGGTVLVDEETTDRTVARIAANAEYRDAGAFSGIFARHTGQRPREYRAVFRRRSDRSAAETRRRET